MHLVFLPGLFSSLAAAASPSPPWPQSAGRYEPGQHIDCILCVRAPVLTSPLPLFLLRNLCEGHEGPWTSMGWEGGGLPQARPGCGGASCRSICTDLSPHLGASESQVSLFLHIRGKKRLGVLGLGPGNG